ncbi:NAD-dependent epimerase/dehydratase family protein [Pacificimonas sp. ICDLI1SI03]
MTTLVYGASGYLGGRLVRHFKAKGEPVLGFLRNEHAAGKLRDEGIEPILGDLADLDAACSHLARADTIIYAAQLELEPERIAIERMLDALAGSGKTFIFTSGTGVLSQRTDGDWSEDTFAETDSFTPSKYIGDRMRTEAAVQDAHLKGVRGLVIRPSLIWGHGGCLTIANFFESARKTGSVCYIGRGLNLYSSVHVDDLCNLFDLTAERGVDGHLYHAVSGETNFRTIAQAVAQELGVEARSVTLSEAMEIWDKFTALIGMSVCSRSRAPLARNELGWTPDLERLDILDEVSHPAFRANSRD